MTHHGIVTNAIVIYVSHVSPMLMEKSKILCKFKIIKMSYS
jgi:hypothetical protein